MRRRLEGVLDISSKSFTHAPVLPDFDVPDIMIGDLSTVYPSQYKLHLLQYRWRNVGGEQKPFAFVSFLFKLVFTVTQQSV